MHETRGTEQWDVRQRHEIDDETLGERFVAENSEDELSAVLDALSRLG